jgi:Domain of unknown function (DUF1707)
VPPNDNPQMRASDADRDRVSAMLREHMAAGRLTLDEFQERLDALYTAKTLGQLDEITADLPGIDLYRLPEATMRESQATRGDSSLIAPEPPGRTSHVWRHQWASWASVTMMLFVIWLITAVSSHSAAGLWFLWVSGPWGAILLGRWIFGQHPDGGGPGHIQGGPQNQLGSAERQRQLDEHMQHNQEHMQEQMRRRQEHMQRRQERNQRRYGPPGGGPGSPEEY